jgi:hypothetical protein
MGVGYSRPVTQWSKGEYTGANNHEDDLSVITSTGVSYRADDHGNDAAHATALGADLAASGVITARADTDWFSWTSPGGSSTVTVAPAPASPDLDASLTVYDTDGTTVLKTANPSSARASADVATGLGATLTFSAAAGHEYYLAIDGVGSGAAATDGYSDYASLGQYTASVVTAGALAVAIETDALPDGVQGGRYSARVVAGGGAAPLTFAATGLPAGLAISTDGVISGVPTTAFAASVPVTVTDANGASASRALPLSITTGVEFTTAHNLPAATVGAPYETTLTATGGQAPYTFAATEASQAPWLTLAPDGALSGTPTAQGSPTLTIRVDDALGHSAEAAFTLPVNAPPGSLSITPSQLPALTVGAPVQVPLSVQGATGAVTWRFGDTGAPAWLQLDSTGRLSGQPSAAGPIAFSVVAADSAGHSGTVDYSPTVADPVAVATVTLPEATARHNYPTRTLVAAGGTGHYTWTSTALPFGLTLTADGTIGGIPAAAGTTQLTVTATDTEGRVATRGLTLTVRAPLTISTTALPPATRTGSYTAHLAATGGTAQRTWGRTAGTLPAGLSLSGSGALTGRPRTTGSFPITVNVRDSVGRGASRSFRIVVAAPPVIRTTSLAPARHGHAYGQTLSAAAGSAPYRWSVASGRLSAGLHLAVTGRLSGTPKRAGTATVTIAVTDRWGVRAQHRYRLIVR